MSSTRIATVELKVVVNVELPLGEDGIDEVGFEAFDLVTAAAAKNRETLMDYVGDLVDAIDAAADATIEAPRLVGVVTPIEHYEGP